MLKRSTSTKGEDSLIKQNKGKVAPTKSSGDVTGRKGNPIKRKSSGKKEDDAPDPKVEEAAVVEASAKKKSERGRWRLSLEMRKDKEDEIEREPENGKKKKKVKSVKKKGQKNSENHSEETAAGGKKEEREKKADREDKENEEEVQARQITDEDLSPSSKLSDSPRSPPEDKNKEEEAESDEDDESQSSPSDTTHNDSDKEEGSPLQQHEESGAGAVKPMASTPARVSSLRELSPARGIPKTSGSESDASRKTVGVETKKKQLIGLRMFESADGPSTSSASSKKSSAKGGMIAAVSDKRHSKYNDPIRRRRRSTLDDATSDALTKLAKQTPSNNKRPTVSPIIAHLAMPFMGQSQKGTLEDSANSLPTISENSPTEGEFFQWPDKGSHKSKKDDGLNATLKIRNRRKRSSIVSTPQTTPVLQALAEANFTDQNIWEGEPKLFAILQEYKHVLMATGDSLNVVTFQFPDISEFNGVKTKTYKVRNNQPIRKLLGSILKRTAKGISTRRFGLTTLGGYTLDDKETLLSYGLGSLLETWELRIIEKQAVPKRAIPPRPNIAVPLLHVPAPAPVTPNQRSSGRRTPNSGDLQHQIEGKILTARFEYHLEDRDRKIAELVNQLNAREEGASKLKEEFKEMVSTREAALRLAIKNELLSRPNDKEVNDRLKEFVDEVEGLKKEGQEDKERHEETLSKMKDELQRSQELMKELIKQNKDMKAELEDLRNVTTKNGIMKEEERKGKGREGEEANTIPVERLNSELATIRKEMEEKQQSMMERIFERLDSDKKEVKAAFKENEKRLKEDNENLKRMLNEKEQQMKEERKEFSITQSRLEGMIAQLESRLDEDKKDRQNDVARLNNSASALQAFIDTHGLELSLLTKNVDNLMEHLLVAQKTEESFEERLHTLEQQSQQAQQKGATNTDNDSTTTFHAAPPPPPTPMNMDFMMMTPKTGRHHRGSSAPEKGTLGDDVDDFLFGGPLSEILEEESDANNKAVMSLEEQLMTISLKKTNTSGDDSQRSSRPSEPLGDHASLLLSGLQKRFSNMLSIESEELEDLSDDASDDDMDDF